MDPFKLQTLGAVFANECLRRQKNRKKKKEGILCLSAHKEKYVSVRAQLGPSVFALVAGFCLGNQA